MYGNAIILSCYLGTSNNREPYIQARIKVGPASAQAARVNEVCATLPRPH
jgi:hypothetical protein